jgi:hypothetical protein
LVDRGTHQLIRAAARQSHGGTRQIDRFKSHRALLAMAVLIRPNRVTEPMHAPHTTEGSPINLVSICPESVFRTRFCNGIPTPAETFEAETASAMMASAITENAASSSTSDRAEALYVLLCCLSGVSKPNFIISQRFALQTHGGLPCPTTLKGRIGFHLRVGEFGAIRVDCECWRQRPLSPSLPLFPFRQHPPSLSTRRRTD